MQGRMQVKSGLKSRTVKQTFTLRLQSHAVVSSAEWGPAFSSCDSSSSWSHAHHGSITVSCVTLPGLAQRSHVHKWPLASQKPGIFSFLPKTALDGFFIYTNLWLPPLLTNLSANFGTSRVFNLESKCDSAISKISKSEICTLVR